MNKFLIATTSLCAIAIPASASAQTASPTDSVAVSYSDLDLSTGAGRRTLQSRLRAAANQLCANGTQGGITVQFQRQACMRQAHFSAQAGLRVAIASANRGDVLAAR